MMPRETILAVYEQGPDAVVDLVEHLFAQLADHQEQLRSQQETIASLTARVEELPSMTTAGAICDWRALFDMPTA